MHILDEIRFLRINSRGLNLEGLKEDPVMQRAFPEDLKEDHPEIEWRKIAGLRDKLIHHYFEVDWEIVWDVVIGRIPSIEDELEAMVSSMES
jgi:uncharacterized protein with HEPN domain